MSTDDEDRALIRAAMAYRSGADSINEVYLGSMAKAGLYHVLGLRLTSEDFDKALDQANRMQLDLLLSGCKHVIEYMRTHPVTRCPCCGQIVSADRMAPFKHRLAAFLEQNPDLKEIDWLKPG
jgi:hypothetical protein